MSAPARPAGSPPEPAPRLPAAVVFDCDGTLADTEPLSDRAWSEALAARGYTLTPADVQAVVGRSEAATLAHLATRTDLGDLEVLRRRVRARMDVLLATELTLFDDAVTVLRTLVARGVPVAVASSSHRDHVQRVLVAGGLLGVVPVVVAAEDVRHPKPAPEPYLRAAAALGVPPHGCTAVEDTPVGVAAARDRKSVV